MNIKRNLGRALGLVAAFAIGGLGLTGVASASTARPAVIQTFSDCVFLTTDGHYLTAVGGGGRTNDVIHTDAVRVGAWERFQIWDLGDGHYGIRTTNLHWLTAVGGGGRITNVIHSDVSHLQSWEKFSLVYLGSGEYAIQTINGHYLTAVGGGGRITDTIHSDATRVLAWEKFRFACGL